MNRARQPAKKSAKKPAQKEISSARVLLITGMSGAGKSSALKALEDMGYETVDNAPLSLLGSLVPRGRQRADIRPLAIGIDIRTRDFGAAMLIGEIGKLIKRPGLDVRLAFMDCDDDVLTRRYTETRHRHPLAEDRPLTDGIRHERRLVAPLIEEADVAIDTSDMTLADLKRVLEGHFRVDSEHGLGVFVTSFSYKKGLPREADLVFDVRFLRNPHYEPRLKDLTGKERAVGDYIRRDKDYAGFMARLEKLLKPLLPRYAGEGKSYLTIAVGCTGGRHRSVFVAERLARWLAAEGERVQVHHRDMETAAKLDHNRRSPKGRGRISGDRTS